MVRKGKISLMLGLIAGTLTGLLFAPKRGSQLREKIIKERREGGLGHKAIADDLSEMVNQLKIFGLRLIRRLMTLPKEILIWINGLRRLIKKQIYLKRQLLNM